MARSTPTNTTAIPIEVFFIIKFNSLKWTVSD
jgi:hypothetical protein